MFLYSLLRFNLTEINQRLDVRNLQAKISKWGERVVTLEGYKGSISLSTLTNRLYDTLSTITSEQDHNAAAALLPKLQQLYQRTVEEEKNLKGFTWLLFKVRSLFNGYFPLAEVSFTVLPELLESQSIENQVRRFFKSGVEQRRIFTLLHEGTPIQIGIIFNPTGKAVESLRIRVDDFVRNDSSVALVYYNSTPKQLVKRIKKWIPENLGLSVISRGRIINGQTSFKFLGLAPLH